MRCTDAPLEGSSSKPPQWGRCIAAPLAELAFPVQYYRLARAHWDMRLSICIFTIIVSTASVSSASLAHYFRRTRAQWVRCTPAPPDSQSLLAPHAASGMTDLHCRSSIAATGLPGCQVSGRSRDRLKRGGTSSSTNGVKIRHRDRAVWDGIVHRRPNEGQVSHPRGPA